MISCEVEDLLLLIRLISFRVQPDIWQAHYYSIPRKNFHATAPLIKGIKSLLCGECRGFIPPPWQLHQCAVYFYKLFRVLKSFHVFFSSFLVGPSPARNGPARLIRFQYLNTKIMLKMWKPKGVDGAPPRGDAGDSGKFLSWVERVGHLHLVF